MAYNELLIVGPIPQEMKQRKNWILWGKGEAKANNRFKKIPLNLDGAPWDKVTTWTFDEAFESARQKELGIAFSLKDTPYCVLDLDLDDDESNRILHGYLLAQFRNTYIEKSISGRGYHIVVNDPSADNLYVESRMSLSCLCHSMLNEELAPWIILTGINPTSWLTGGTDKPVIECKLADIPLMKQIYQAVETLRLADEEYEEMMAENDDDPYYL